MLKHDIIESLADIKAKVEFLACNDGEMGKTEKYGFYLVVSDISAQINKVSEEVSKLREAPQNDNSEPKNG